MCLRRVGRYHHLRRHYECDVPVDVERHRKLGAAVALLYFRLSHGLCARGGDGFFLWLAGEPMLEKLERIQVKYGLVE